jgi:hypothetical protein
MCHFRVSAFVLLFTLSPILLGAAPEEAPEAYEIAQGATLLLLPQPLGAFFTVHSDALGAAAQTGSDGALPDKFPGGPGSHYIMLDAGVAPSTAASTSTAVGAFPRKESAARSLFGRHDLRGGALPWVLADRHRRLTKAFHKGRYDEILKEAGFLIHLATDAALPFNTTRNRDGGLSGHVRWSARNEAFPDAARHRTVRHRLQVAAFPRLYDRLTYEVRVAPERYRVLSDPIDATFRVLFESHRTLDDALAIDRCAMADLGLVDAGTFARAVDDYYERVADAAAALLESRLESAALLAAGLIGSAWVDAGSPDPAAWSTDSRSLNEAAVGSGDQADTGSGPPFVGSRHSVVFHRANCPHAQRIKPANRVFFETVEGAQGAGRVPCRSCKPAAP